SARKAGYTSAQVNGITGTNIDWPGVELIDIETTHHVGDQHKYQFVVDALDAVFAKEVFEHRNLCQPGNTGNRLLFGVLKDAAKQTDFTFLKANEIGRASCRESVEVLV